MRKRLVRKLFYFLIVGVIGFPGCFYKKNKSGREHNLPLFTDEIRLTDVPFPLGSKSFLLSSSGQTGLAVRVVHMMEPSALVRWYEHQMERLSWQLVIRSIGEHESLLIFEKPHRRCVVSLREPQRFVLFVGQTIS